MPVEAKPVIPSVTNPEQSDPKKKDPLSNSKDAINKLYLPKGKKILFIRLCDDFFPQSRDAAIERNDFTLEAWTTAVDRAKQNPLLDIAYRTLVKNLTENGVIHPSCDQEKQLRLKTQESRQDAFEELCNLYQITNPDRPINLTRAANLLGCKKQRTHQIYHKLKKKGTPLPPVVTHEKTPK